MRTCRQLSMVAMVCVIFGETKRICEAKNGTTLTDFFDGEQGKEMVR